MYMCYIDLVLKLIWYGTTDTTEGSMFALVFLVLIGGIYLRIAVK